MSESESHKFSIALSPLRRLLQCCILLTLIELLLLMIWWIFSRSLSAAASTLLCRSLLPYSVNRKEDRALRSVLTSEPLFDRLFSVRWLSFLTGVAKRISLSIFGVSFWIRGREFSCLRLGSFTESSYYNRFFSLWIAYKPEPWTGDPVRP